MALRRDLTYPNRYSSATQQQPQGGFLNRTTPTSNDGSYPEQQWLNDWSALFSSLLVNAGITPNNSVDAVGDSQYFDALMQLISRPNVLINSDLTFANAINQRGVASWSAVALNDYGLDRWKKVDTSTIIQPVEQGNFIPNETYTLSWNNGADSRVIVAPTSGDWENSDLEIPITATGATKLELGKNRTTWSPDDLGLNLAKCQRYFWSGMIGGNDFVSGANNTYIIETFNFPTQMRRSATPSVKLISGKLWNHNGSSVTVEPKNGFSVFGISDSFFFEVVFRTATYSDPSIEFISGGFRYVEVEIDSEI